MSKNITIVKIVSIIFVLFGFVTIIGGILIDMESEAVASLSINHPIVTAQALGIALVVLGIMYLATGILGIKETSRPYSLRPFIILCVVITIINLIELIVGISNGDSSIDNLVFIALSAVGFVYASRARHNAL